MVPLGRQRVHVSECDELQFGIWTCWLGNFLQTWMFLHRFCQPSSPSSSRRRLVVHSPFGHWSLNLKCLQQYEVVRSARWLVMLQQSCWSSRQFWTDCCSQDGRRRLKLSILWRQRRSDMIQDSMEDGTEEVVDLGGTIKLMGWKPRRSGKLLEPSQIEIVNDRKCVDARSSGNEEEPKKDSWHQNWLEGDRATSTRTDCTRERDSRRERQNDKVSTVNGCCGNVLSMPCSENKTKMVAALHLILDR